MPLNIEDLTQEVLSLPSEARAMLADRLVESLDPAEDGVVHRLWAEEVQRRVAQIEDGSVALIPAATVFASLRQKYGG